MQSEKGIRSVYCVLTNEVETSVAMQAAREICPNCRIEIFDNFQAFILRIKTSSELGSQRCLVTSGDLPDETTEGMFNAIRAHDIYLPIVLIDSGQNPQRTHSPFDSLISINRPVSDLDMQDAINKAFELSGKFSEMLSQTDRFQDLTQRETEIVRLATEGIPNKSIARRLSVSIKTIEKYRRSAYEKLDIASTAEMASLVTFTKFCAPSSFQTVPGIMLMNQMPAV